MQRTGRRLPARGVLRVVSRRFLASLSSSESDAGIARAISSPHSVQTHRTRLVDENETTSSDGFRQPRRRIFDDLTMTISRYNSRRDPWPGPSEGLQDGSEGLGPPKTYGDALVQDVDVHIAVPSWQSMGLSLGARRALVAGNHGGSSELSEALSVEVLERAFGWNLVYAEREVPYFWPNRKLLDFLAVKGALPGSVQGQNHQRHARSTSTTPPPGKIVSVSVTRAFDYQRGPLTNEHSRSLLKRKLAAVQDASENTRARINHTVLHILFSGQRSSDLEDHLYEHEPQAMSTISRATQLNDSIAILTGNMTAAARAAQEQGKRDRALVRGLLAEEEIKKLKKRTMVVLSVISNGGWVFEQGCTVQRRKR